MRYGLLVPIAGIILVIAATIYALVEPGWWGEIGLGVIAVFLGAQLVQTRSFRLEAPAAASARSRWTRTITRAPSLDELVDSDGRLVGDSDEVEREMHAKDRTAHPEPLGKLTYNPPGVMRLEVPVTFKARVVRSSADTAAVQAAMTVKQGEEPMRGTDVPTADEMNLKVIGRNGAFKVEAHTDSPQRLDSKRGFAEWMFTVTPQAPGLQKLVLVLTTTRRDPSGALISIDSDPVEVEIDVQVKPALTKLPPWLLGVFVAAMVSLAGTIINTAFGAPIAKMISGWVFPAPAPSNPPVPAPGPATPPTVTVTPEASAAAPTTTTAPAP